MSYNSEPDSEYVAAFAERQKKRWGAQQILDTRAYKLYAKKSPIDVAEAKSQAGKSKIRHLRTGFAGMQIDRDTSTLSPICTFTFAPPDGSIENERHASYLLEPWVASAYEQSQIEPVTDECRKDLRLYGRFWMSVFPLPGLWADDDMDKMVAELCACMENGANEKKVRALRREIEEYKHEVFPIRTQHCDATTTWPLLSVERRVPEVVQIRKLTVEEAIADFGEEKLPEDFTNTNAESEIELYIYANWYWTCSVLAKPSGGIFRKIFSKTETNMVRKWKHNFGANPFILAEANLAPRNDEGVRWKSALFDYHDLIEAMDEALSDWRHSNRQNTLKGLLFKISRESRGLTDPEQLAHPEILIKDEPGENVVMHSDEAVEELPSPQINTQVVQLTQWLDEKNMMLTLDPTQRGKLLSGQSQVAYTTGLQVARQILRPYAAAIVEADKQWVDRAFRCVIRLSEEYPDAPDKVYVVHGKMGKIGVGPGDVAGWARLVQPKFTSNIEMNENAMMDLMVAAEKAHIPPQIALERWGNFDNPLEILDLMDKWQIRQALLGDLIQRAKEIAVVLAGKVPTQDLATLAQDVASLPPAAQMALAQQGIIPTPAGAPGMPGTTPGSPGAMMQGMSNERRAGVPQAPSETAANALVPGPVLQ